MECINIPLHCGFVSGGDRDFAQEDEIIFDMSVSRQLCCGAC